MFKRSNIPPSTPDATVDSLLNDSFFEINNGSYDEEISLINSQTLPLLPESPDALNTYLKSPASNAMRDFLETTVHNIADWANQNHISTENLYVFKMHYYDYQGDVESIYIADDETEYENSNRERNGSASYYFSLYSTGIPLLSGILNGLKHPAIPLHIQVMVLKVLISTIEGTYAGSSITECPNGTTTNIQNAYSSFVGYLSLRNKWQDIRTKLATNLLIELAPKCHIPKHTLSHYVSHVLENFKDQYKLKKDAIDNSSKALCEAQLLANLQDKFEVLYPQTLTLENILNYIYLEFDLVDFIFKLNSSSDIKTHLENLTRQLDFYGKDIAGIFTFHFLFITQNEGLIKENNNTLLEESAPDDDEHSLDFSDNENDNASLVNRYQLAWSTEYIIYASLYQRIKEHNYFKDRETSQLFNRHTILTYIPKRSLKYAVVKFSQNTREISQPLLIYCVEQCIALNSKKLEPLISVGLTSVNRQEILKVLTDFLNSYSFKIHENSEEIFAEILSFVNELYPRFPPKSWYPVVEKLAIEFINKGITIHSAIIHIKKLSYLYKANILAGINPSHRYSFIKNYYQQLGSIETALLENDYKTLIDIKHTSFLLNTEERKTFCEFFTDIYLDKKISEFFARNLLPEPQSDFPRNFSSIYANVSISLQEKLLAHFLEHNFTSHLKQMNVFNRLYFFTTLLESPPQDARYSIINLIGLDAIVDAFVDVEENTLWLEFLSIFIRNFDEPTLNLIFATPVHSQILKQKLTQEWEKAANPALFVERILNNLSFRSPKRLDILLWLNSNYEIFPHLSIQFLIRQVREKDRLILIKNLSADQIFRSVNTASKLHNFFKNYLPIDCAAFLEHLSSIKPDAELLILLLNYKQLLETTSNKILRMMPSTNHVIFSLGKLLLHEFKTIEAQLEFIASLPWNTLTPEEFMHHYREIYATLPGGNFLLAATAHFHFNADMHRALYLSHSDKQIRLAVLSNWYADLYACILETISSKTNPKQVNEQIINFLNILVDGFNQTAKGIFNTHTHTTTDRILHKQLTASSKLHRDSILNLTCRTVKVYCQLNYSEPDFTHEVLGILRSLLKSPLTARSNGNYFFSVSREANILKTCLEDWIEKYKTINLSTEHRIISQAHH